MKRRIFLLSSVVAAASAVMARVSPAQQAARPGALRAACREIDGWLDSHAPRIRRALNAPASPRELDGLGATIGASLPADLLALYQWHDGIDNTRIANLFYGLVFDGVAVADRNARAAENAGAGALRYADAGIDPAYGLARSRMQIGSDSARCHLCVDLAPTSQGAVGQVILVDEEYRVALKLAGSVGEMMMAFAADLKSGRYTLSEEAAADGEQWLEPEPDLDVANWFKSPAWARAQAAAKL